MYREVDITFINDACLIFRYILTSFHFVKTLNMTSLECIVLYYASINYHNKQLLLKVQ